MLNNSGTYGSNEAPTGMITPLNRPQSTAHNISNNLNNFGKIVQQATSSPSGHYEGHNFSNFAPPTIEPHRFLNPFQTHQSMGPPSSYFPQNSSYNHENAFQNCFTNISTSTQSEHYNNMLNCHQNFLSNPSVLSDHGPNLVKRSPINIISSTILQDKFNSVLQDPQSVMPTYTQNISDLYPKISNENNESYNQTNLNLDSQPSFESTQVLSTNHKNNLETALNTSQEEKSSSEIQMAESNLISDSNTDKNNFDDSITTPPTRLNTCISERKRKSLEKTVRLIESILIKSSNNNTKSDIMEKKLDPLQRSPKPYLSKSDNDSHNKTHSDSDNEVLIDKVVTNRRKSKSISPPKKIESTRRSHVIETETEIQMQRRIELGADSVVVKVEFTNLSDIDYSNPFLRDSNGLPRDSISDGIVVDMENSVETAHKAVKNVSGTSPQTYYECPYCSLLVSNPKRFLVHTKWHTFGLINSTRAEIAREREERVKMKREARMVRGVSVTEVTNAGADMFFCKDCDKVFQTRSSLKSHRRRDHRINNGEVTECRICLTAVNGAKALRAHMAVHEDKEAGVHQCPNCPKRFKYRHSLAKHADTHLEKTHACPECSKMFGSAQLVKLHMKTHERVARGAAYHCSYCGKGFYETYNLNVHERTHRQEKPYKCDICESCFVTNSSLKRHVKVSHCGAKPHACVVCQKCFSTESIRDRHTLRVHAEQGQLAHSCTMCSKRYLKQKDLKNHMNKMHPKEKKKDATSETEQVSESS